jgi:hypothetical protein
MVELAGMPKKYIPPPAPEPKVFRSGEFAPAIAKLNRRIDVVQKFIDEKLYEEDQRVEVAEQDTRNTILAVFGRDSPEYRKHDYFWRVRGRRPADADRHCRRPGRRRLGHE